MPEAKSHRGEGSRPTKATVKPSPAGQRPKPGRVKRKFCVVPGMGIGKESSQ